MLPRTGPRCQILFALGRTDPDFSWFHYKLLRIVLRSLPARSWFESRHKIAERSHDAHPSETSGLLFEIVDPKMSDGPAHALARTRDHSPVEGVGIQGKLIEGS